MRKVTVKLDPSDAFYSDREFIEGKVLIEIDNRFEFESDEDIENFNKFSGCYTDRQGYRFYFNAHVKKTCL